ncbi:CRISPR-associated protein [Rubrivivax sp. A210]|uniref:type I-G CRISPR-associated protein Csb2 n=1 Tax=Rubrivivax sp. A210 TaxID=2772301 RepID=UPI00191B8762|nr:type I-U CRISPR-associated protein Csb2 [Rubrivivax sp. A210]CAD5374845.1 CRISPR-associated protein [Rubrivivax sp. A210]
MLELQIGFPGGRYFAANNADPRQPEWPPHPSRVYSALVAAAYAGGRQPSAAERQALQQLEAAPPPAIRFPEADVRPAADAYVPVNDPRTRIEAKKGQSQGPLMPNRQVRQFPAAYMLGEPEVALAWDINVSADELQVLDTLAARMTHVGTSHAFVTATFHAQAEAVPTLVPSAAGDIFLRVTRPGRLIELDRLAQQGHGTLRRPPPMAEVLAAYTSPAAAPETLIASRYDWVTLRLRDASWGADTANTLGRALRRAAMALIGDDMAAEVHGHDEEVPHVAWLPLPDVGHVHARGRVIGIAIALPLSMKEQDRLAALASLARLQRLTLPDGQVAGVAPVIDGPEVPVALRSSTWRQASTHWSTVTPVLLDRPPRKSNSDTVAAALADSLDLAGFPRPVSIRACQTSDFDGAPAAMDIPTRVPRWHARIVFDRPVEGPVIAGRWKNFGVGLFRPTPMELRS